MQRAEFRCFSEPGMGKDEVDGNKGKTMPRMMRALARGFNQEDDEEVFTALEVAKVAGQNNAVLRLDREHEDLPTKKTRHTLPNMQSMYCFGIDNAGITMFELFDHEHFVSTGVLKGYGDGVRYLKDDLDKYRLQTQTTTAFLDRPIMPTGSSADAAMSNSASVAPGFSKSQQKQHRTDGEAVKRQRTDDKARNALEDGDRKLAAAPPVKTVACSRCERVFLTETGRRQHERSSSCVSLLDAAAVRRAARSTQQRLDVIDVDTCDDDKARKLRVGFVTVSLSPGADTGLGVSFERVDDVIFVSSIESGGAAHHSMRIDCGYRLLRINDAVAAPTTFDVQITEAISSDINVVLDFRRSAPPLPCHGAARRVLYHTAVVPFTAEQISFLEVEVFHNQRQRVRDRRAYLMMKERFKNRLGDDGKPLWLEQSQIVGWISRRWAELKKNARAAGAAAASARATIAAAAAPIAPADAPAAAPGDNNDDYDNDDAGGSESDDDVPIGNGGGGGGGAGGGGGDDGGDGGGGDENRAVSYDGNMERLPAWELRERLRAIGINAVVRKAELVDGKTTRDVLLARLFNLPDV